MDPLSIITIIAGGATAIGGFFGARKMSHTQAINSAQATVGLMRERIELLETREAEKNATIDALMSRIEALEALVLQRVDLQKIKDDVAYIKEKLDA